MKHPPNLLGYPLKDTDSNRSEPESFACPACGKKFRWKPEFAGKRIRCKCDNKFAVPQAPPSGTVEPEVYDFDELAAMEDAAETHDAGPGLATNWMEDAAEQRKKKRRKPKDKQSGPGGGSEWGKLHISDTLVFAIDVTGMFTKGGAGWSRIDFLVGYTLRCLILFGAGIAVLAYAYKMKPIDEQFNANATPAAATIASFDEVDKEGARKKFNPERWEFTYTVRIDIDGTEYTNSITSTKAGLPSQLDVDKPEQLVGAEVNVLYDAKNPSEIRLPFQKHTNRFVYFATVGWILIGVGSINAVLALLVVVRR